MLKKKPFFIVFEGIEGSGKSFLSKKIFKILKSKGYGVTITREPGGTSRAEKIRKIILADYFNSKIKEKFHKYTDTLLYLAARNEHIQNVIKPALKKNKIVICDRFTDSTIAYQVYGKKVDKKFIDNIHLKILNGIKPDLTFVLKVNIENSKRRLKKRKVKNRYDKFSKSFYINAQKAFIHLAKKDKKYHHIINNSNDDKRVVNNLLKIIMKRINGKK